MRSLGIFKQQPGWWRLFPRLAILLSILLTVVLSSCAMNSPFGSAPRMAVSSPTSTAKSTAMASATSTPAGGTTPSATPVWNSTQAVRAMQGWAAQVRSGRITDGLLVHSLSNSGFIRDEFQPNSYMPYGLTTIHHSSTIGTDTIEIAIGAIEYVFRYAVSGSSSPTMHYGLLFGTVSASGQPVTFLVWLSADTILDKPAVGISVGDGEYIALGTHTYSLAHDSDIAAWLGSRGVLLRTVSLNFLEQWHYNIGPNKNPTSAQLSMMARNVRVVSLVAHPAFHQASDGVFAALPSAALTLSLQDGAESPSDIVLPSAPDIGF